VNRGPEATDTLSRHRVPRMATTHYFPPDGVHCLRDASNQPHLAVGAGDTVAGVFW